MEDISKYAHSPAHLAVARRDYTGLRRLISTLPQLAKAGEVNTEGESLEAELKAVAISAVLDRRDVPGRETPLHLAVRLHDPVSADILIAAGANWFLQNEHGWSALQEAVFTREEAIAMTIARHNPPLVWTKWCRRLPRIVASAGRIRDFYMEITFHFESSVIPFIDRFAPSDTYRIWKRGANLRFDMTFAGFDGFHIRRSNRTLLFLGEGYTSEDSNMSLSPGSLILLFHKEKKATNAMEWAGAQPTESEVAHKVALMSQNNKCSSRIDATQAELVPQLNWRRQERSETVGNRKAKVYDMLHFTVSVKSRRVPGATDEENFSVDDEERMAKEKKGSENSDDPEDSKTLKKFSKLRPEGSNQKQVDSQKSSSEFAKEDVADGKKGKDKGSKMKKKNMYEKDLRPVLWLTPDVPLKMEEFLPLLDILILANKAEVIIGLRELLTTKLPSGTFPVKIAIPILATIRLLVTFTKFEKLQPMEGFSTPVSSPDHFQDGKSKESEGSTSWISWMKGSRSSGQSNDGDSHRYKDEVDPFHIPPDYTWLDADEIERRYGAKKAETQEAQKAGSSQR